ncbi:uncharacterized protein LAJ45_10325 [Morchella importuna]|uniref:uncharacterized protein n=1 Tax=Morchella importuna TaxID=1174673 RepID=UPI001E8E8737|nr:uncharacterized protein LAJ45_10325 [Morchella importuna]KAH8145685.1 hypothetical protein LAJ45_10325 [Morchella importuna]
MTLGTETISLLRQNLDALTSIILPGAMTQDERKTALHTLMMTAEAGAKLAEAVHVEALTTHHTSGAPGVEALINGKNGAAAKTETEKQVGGVAGGLFGGGGGGGVKSAPLVTGFAGLGSFRSASP